MCVHLSSDNVNTIRLCYSFSVPYSADDHMDIEEVSMSLSV